MSEKKGRGRPKKSIINDDKKNIVKQNDNQSSFEQNNNDIPNENMGRNDNFEQNEYNHAIEHNDSVSDNVNESLDNNNDNNSSKKTFKKPKSNKSSSTTLTDSNDELDSELDNELAEFEKQEGLNDIPEDTFRPLDGAVKKRGYTGGNMGLDNNDIPDSNNNAGNNGDNVIYKQEKGSEKVIDEPKYTGVGHSKKPEVDATLINPSNSQGEVLDSNDNNNYYNQNQNQNQQKKSFKNNNNGNSGGGDSGNNNGSGGNGGGQNNAKSEKEESNLKELSAKEKRDAVEKTADYFLLAYRQYIPPLFVYFGSHNLKKLKKLEKNGEIDLDFVIKKDGTTILNYVNEFNKEVEEAFRITDAEIEAIRPALVDVMMEQEIAFTPVQRLMFVVGQFLLAKIMLLIKFIKRKKADLEEIKEHYLDTMEKLESIRLQNEEIKRQNEEILNRTRESQNTQNNPQQNQTHQQPQPQQNQTPPTQQHQQHQQHQQQQPINNTNNNTDNSNIRIVKNDSDKTVSDADIVSESKNNNTNNQIKNPSLDDVLNTDLNQHQEGENDGNNNGNDDNQDIPE